MDSVLARWISMQRKHREQKVLSQERIELLDGYLWDLNEEKEDDKPRKVRAKKRNHGYQEQWDELYLKLIAYKEKVRVFFLLNTSF